jgi:hypothetical protein
MSDLEAPPCRDEQQRRADILAAQPQLNGIDYLEVDPADHRVIYVFFLRPLAPLNPANPADPQDALGITGDLERITVTGGVRIVGIRATAAARQADGSLRLQVTAGGDYSTYTLSIQVPGLDPLLRRTEFSFMASCPVDFDCAPAPYCPPSAPEEPRLDYQARDYASFRRMLLDLVPRLNPGFLERNPSDLGIALVELLAYTGDHLAYFQDAVANEAYLERVRQRASARRHARLVDYRMHDGRNAWTWVHLAVNAPRTLGLGTVLVTRVHAPLRGQAAPPGAVVQAFQVTPEAVATDPALREAAVFETTHAQDFHPLNNAIRIHAWGNEECCLSPGAREAFLFSVNGATAERPVLRDGDFLLLEEVLGPATGVRADADPAHRVVVRIEGEPEQTEDPIYARTLAAGELARRQAGDPALPLLRVRWRRDDALGFAFCLSKRRAQGDLIRNVTLARGNLVLADHGITMEETATLAAPVQGDEPFRLPLREGPLTMECQPEPERMERDSLTARVSTDRMQLDCMASEARASVGVIVTFPTGPELWEPVPDLLDSPRFARHFVAEVGNDGRATLRFGDGEYGREPAGATAFRAVYRIGNGRVGNVGAESVAHVAVNGPAGWIDGVRNPLAATGGVDAESIEEVRRRAPQAFRAEQFRAVTEADYVAAARRLPDVAGAVAAFRWTGSWYTVFVAVDPADPADLVRRPRGLTRLSDRLERKVRAFLTRYRLAGYDLEIRPPRFVPLEIEVEICALRDHFRADVAKAVVDALSARILPNGARGFFHSDNFTFGQPVYLSRLYAAVERVEGVDSAVVRVFRRAGGIDAGELQKGVIPIGPWEIAQLDNDPSFMENGVLRAVARGGKG